LASIINNLRRKKYRQKNNRGKINDIKNPRDHSWKTTARHFVIELFKAELSRPAVVSPRTYNAFNNILSILLMAPTFERFYYTIWRKRDNCVLFCPSPCLFEQGKNLIR